MGVVTCVQTSPNRMIFGGGEYNISKKVFMPMAASH